MSTFATQLNQSIRKKDGLAVSRLMSITNSELPELAMFSNDALVDKDIRNKINDPQWGEVAVCHWRVACQVAKYQNLHEAYTAQNALLRLVFCS